MDVRDYVVLTCFHRPTEVNILIFKPTLAQTTRKVKDGCVDPRTRHSTIYQQNHKSILRTMAVVYRHHHWLKMA